jgi:hypothetical protein
VGRQEGFRSWHFVFVGRYRPVSSTATEKHERVFVASLSGVALLINN